MRNAECGMRNAGARRRACPEQTVGLSPGFLTLGCRSGAICAEGSPDEASPADSGDSPFRAHALIDLRISADPVALAHCKTQWPAPASSLCQRTDGFEF